MSWYLQGTEPEPPLVDVHHFSKGEHSRGGAWDRVSRSESFDRNPWRKCHTENYWVWYRVEEETDT